MCFIILPLVLCGYETWCFISWEECRVRVFENRVLRRVFGPKWGKVTWKWRKLHNEELNFLYASTDIVQVIKSRRMGWLGHVASMGRGEVHTGFW